MLKHRNKICKKICKELRQNFFTGILLGTGAIAIAALLSLCILLFKLKQEYRQFLKRANLSHAEVEQIIKSALQQHNQFVQLAKQGQNLSVNSSNKTQSDQNNFSTDLKENQNVHQQQQVLSRLSPTFLLLGLDQVANRAGDPLLTDSMLLLRAHPLKQQIKTVSLPRDLWVKAYQTKINALYTYGQDRFPQQPEQFPTQVVSNLAQIQIDYTLVLSLKQVSELIDLVGGVEITVEQGFTDHQFPRSDVDLQQVSDPQLLYQTISFKPGKQTMDAKRALQYIRSRHSDSEQGSDLARSQRQQQIIQALLNKLTTPQLYWQQPYLGAELIRYYQDNFAQYVPIADFLALGLNFLGLGEIDSQHQQTELGQEVARPQLEFISNQLPVHPEKNAVIYHPPQTSFHQQQWVYLIQDRQDFAHYVQAALQ